VIDFDAVTKAKTAVHYPQVEVGSRQALREWLQHNHSHSKGIWLVTRKRSAGGAMAWNDIVEEALCFGWVDSLPRKLDDARTMLLLTPRKPRSNWSKKNKDHVASLQERGLMHTAGMKAVEAAKQNGAWNGLDAVSALTIPADLDLALSQFSLAKKHFVQFPPSVKRGILEWILNARRPETRAARIEETARLAQDNVRANQWRATAK
jgi:uncharacterized protein YdeI (YjbR/CyaY-like superfamily)